MKIAYYIKSKELQSDQRVEAVLEALREGGCTLYQASGAAQVQDGTEMLLSFGGDGTFLSAARFASAVKLPVLGVGMGRLGFLSAARPEDVAPAILEGRFSVENRTMLRAEVEGASHIALNEIVVSREGPSMLGIDVTVDSAPLPTYWCDGLIVATSSGSTAYSLSVGGPICAPESKVLIISPIAPHNFNVRPLVVPDTAQVTVKFRSREARVKVAADNTQLSIPECSTVKVCAVPDALRKVNVGDAGFIPALRTKLLWGEDVRNKQQ